MKKIHDIKDIRFEGKNLVLKIKGEEYSFPLKKISRKLQEASIAEREKFEISPSGYGIHWPLVDEDLSVDALLGVEHKLPGFARKKKAI